MKICAHDADQGHAQNCSEGKTRLIQNNGMDICILLKTMFMIHNRSRKSAFCKVRNMWLLALHFMCTFLRGRQNVASFRVFFQDTIFCEVSSSILIFWLVYLQAYAPGKFLNFFVFVVGSVKRRNWMFHRSGFQLGLIGKNGFKISFCRSLAATIAFPRSKTFKVSFCTDSLARPFFLNIFLCVNGKMTFDFRCQKSSGNGRDGSSYGLYHALASHNGCIHGRDPHVFVDYLQYT